MQEFEEGLKKEGVPEKEELKVIILKQHGKRRPEKKVILANSI